MGSYTDVHDEYKLIFNNIKRRQAEVHYFHTYLYDWMAML